MINTTTKTKKITRKFFSTKIFLLILLSAFTVQKASATVANYTFASSPGVYTPLVGATTIASGASWDDASSGIITLPFTFTYNNVAYTGLTINANGFITLGATSSSTLYCGLQSSPANSIAAYAGDLRGNSAASYVGYATVGSAPNRQFVIEWNDCRQYFSAAGNQMTFELILNETTNVVQVKTGTFAITTTLGPNACSDVAGEGGDVGLLGNSTQDFNIRSVINGTTTWATSTTGTLINDVCQLSSTNFPASGLTYTWTPGAVLPMSYVSCTSAFVNSGAGVAKGATNNAIIQVQVVTTGSTSPLSISSLNLSTSGCTNASGDLANAKVFFTGTSNSFSSVTQFGSTTANPNGTFTVNGTATLGEGTNYFWLAYDTRATATLADLLAGCCTQITGSGAIGNRTPTVTCPVGSQSIISEGTWTKVTANAPHANHGVMLLLSNGTVMCHSNSGGSDGNGTLWDILTPDASGSYINGTWTTSAPMIDTRLFFSSQVLKDGRVYVAGGEYGTGLQKAEVYDPIANTWTAAPALGVNVSDANSEILEDGRVMQALVTGNLKTNTIYNPATNNFTAGPSCLGIHNESAWMKLPDNSILFVDRLSTASERYIPATNTWVADATVPVALYDSFGDETGAAVLLPDGRAFFLAAQGASAIYTPSGNASPGTWIAGPTLPNSTGAPDAPMAMMVNGKVLCAVSPAPTSAATLFIPPTYFYEFDYLTNTFTQVHAPGGAMSLNIACYQTNFLCLPDGSVMYAQNQSAASSSYYIYTPSGAPLTAGKPAISGITQTSCTSYQIAGTQFNGISQGANYGDDWQMSTNYPVIRLTNGASTYYCRTFNWNSTGVRRGVQADNVSFTLPAGLPIATYQLVVTANGIASDPISFTPVPYLTSTQSPSAVCSNNAFAYTPAIAPAGATFSWTRAAVAGISNAAVTTPQTSAPNESLINTTGSPVTVVYVFTLTSNGCSNTQNVSVVINPAPVPVITGNSPICINAITLNAGTFSAYNWSNGATTQTTSVSTAGLVSVTVTGSNGCTANTSVTTAIDTKTITASAGANGSISPNGVSTLNCGANQNYTITPNSGFAIQDVLVDGVSQGAISTFAFNALSTNHTISVTFVSGGNNITASAGANGSISPNGVTNVSLGGNQSYTITPNSCYQISDVLVDGVSQGAISTYTFSNVTAPHTISASFTQLRYAVTASAASNGTISPNGATNVTCGNNQSYTITPNSCYQVANVIVDGVSQGAITSYTFTNVTAVHSISASFSQITYTITASAGANGSITPSGASTVNCGENQTYTITPAACYQVANVIVDGVSQGAITTFIFTGVTANHSISATFSQITYTITASAGANGSISPNGASTVNCGANQTYSITPAACYQVADVVVDGVSQGAITTYTFTGVSATHSISASFSQLTYTITASAGANGSISPNGASTVNCGANQTYSITPAACYQVANVIVDGVSQGAITTYTFTGVSATHSISASFSQITYTVTASAGANGSISPNGASTVNCGANQTYSITPAACYQIADVLVDGVSQGAITTYTFTGVSAIHSISASFSQLTYTITATAGANGSISPNGASTVNCGANQSYSITPAACFQVADVVIDGVSQGAITSFTFNTVNANHSISASFSSTTYTITASAGANGSITPNGASNLNCGANQSYTISPAACYQIADVLVDGVSQGAISTFTFTNVTASHSISASFSALTYVITASAGANGSITPSGATTVNCGANQAYSISPAACYQIADVLIDGVSQGPISSFTFNTVNATHTISASFSSLSYTITASAGANGSISPNGTTNVNCGANQSYTISPSSGFNILDVVVDGVSQGAIGAYTFSNVTAAHSISATFSAVSVGFTINASAGANGSISPSGNVNLNSGANQSYTITANSCYVISDVLVDGVSQGAITSYTFTNVTASHSISATFSAITYSITASAGANGTISPSGATTQNCGSTPTYTLTPSIGYVVLNLLVDGVSQGALSTYTFTSLSASHTISATFVKSTGLTSASCNSTVASMYDQIFCSAVPAATNYRYKIENTGLSFNSVYVRNSSLTDFRMIWAAGVQYATTYSVSVAANVGGVWGAYGPACNVTIGPFPTTQLAVGSCGISLSAMSDVFYCVAISGAINYQYRFSNAGLGFSTEALRNNTSNDYRLTWLPSTAALQYATTYQVEVKAYVGGVWGNYGTVCAITTPPVPLTNLQAAYCSNYVLPTFASAVNCVAIPGASNYRYHITGPLGYNKTFNRNSSLTDWRFSWTKLCCGQQNMLPNTTYTVEVAYFTNGVWSAYGNSCTIVTGASVARYTDYPSEASLVQATTALNLLVYPNPSTVNEGFSIELKGLNFETKKVELAIYSILGERVYASEIISKDEESLTIKPTLVLAPGVYMVEAQVEGKVFRSKFIVN